MKIEINKQQAKILWFMINNKQYVTLRELQKTIEDEEELKHISHLVKETRKEYELLTDVKDKCRKVLFEKESEDE